jgi:arabinan endo-1,5-alpha-L-arabinosidase
MRIRAVWLTLLVAACAAPQAPLRYNNPVLDSDFPDPAVLRADDGNYYAYATQGNDANLQVARSADLVHWQPLGDALPVKPVWAATTQEFWAPGAQIVNGRTILHYSAKPDAGGPEAGLCLAVATAARPQGPFTDSGAPLLCGQGFANIDPFAFRDPADGRRWLYWGSGFGPIRVRQLADDGMGFAPGSLAIELLHPAAGTDSNRYDRLIEGAWVVRHGGWYYLFTSGDNCCGPDAYYAVMVARSRRATGPFESRAALTGSPDSVILRAGDRWTAPGHNSVVRDATGTWWIVYHAIDTRRPRSDAAAPPNSRRVLLIDRLVWRKGWPEVAGGVPSATLQPAPPRR